MLNQDQREQLLQMARASIAGGLSDAPLPVYTGNDTALTIECGAFVTIKLAGHLRGCIGLVESNTSLWETVARMARSAAFQDPRFVPLSNSEFEECRIEISAMTRPVPIASEAVVVGQHGLIVERGEQRGLLLPQVAVEQRWDRETFISSTCLKAGLSADAWREHGTAIFAFTAEVFSEASD
jgi:AmmeMemoRadiSam system protein A